MDRGSGKQQKRRTTQQNPQKIYCCALISCLIYKRMFIGKLLIGDRVKKERCFAIFNSENCMFIFKMVPLKNEFHFVFLLFFFFFFFFTFKKKQKKQNEAKKNKNKGNKNQKQNDATKDNKYHIFFFNTKKTPKKNPNYFTAVSEQHPDSLAFLLMLYR
ncbi:hypothetical protein RFI_18366 [Reticulomyxa filosa]|uniref:Uncharacterized protein n=1 Tax=Reticulomyxa filosa TaxID=46433 RepID=X6MZ46_RETFI|nr:hypothetical protein RFI_18366 [Reticulomyxa filosa]|eukprot:ETO18878.1 hypothetical protein RFI_18366 [Reticulomyxa filosa]